MSCFSASPTALRDRTTVGADFISGFCIFSFSETDRPGISTYLRCTGGEKKLISSKVTKQGTNRDNTVKHKQLIHREETWTETRNKTMGHIDRYLEHTDTGKDGYTVYPTETRALLALTRNSWKGLRQMERIRAGQTSQKGVKTQRKWNKTKCKERVLLN